jgi:hypothetical protein
MNRVSLTLVERSRLHPWPLFLLVFLFYVLTLAPTVLWSDSAHLQRMAAQGLLDHDGGGRPVWFLAARFMLLLPIGDPAYRVNLLSALTGALAVALTYLVGVEAQLSRRGALTAAATLAVSHTYWQHAVRAEVYAPFVAVLALQLWLWFKWQPGRPRSIFVAVALLGPLLLSHQMAVLVAPALIYLLAARRRWLGRAQWTSLASIALATGSAALLVLRWQMQAAPAQALFIYLTHSGIDWRPALFDFSWANLPKDALLCSAFFLLQFPSPALLFGAVALPALRERMRDPAWTALLLLGLTDLVFAFAYRVNDRYVFFMPMYLVFALLVGLGWDEIERRWAFWRKPAAWVLALALLVVTPIIAYATVAEALQRLEVNPLAVRNLPYRDPNRYFLWPPLRGYTGAADFARETLAAIPPNSLIIADYTPFEVFSYAQKVTGQGVAARLVRVQPQDDLDALAGSVLPGTAVFLADIDPRYYNLPTLRDYRLEPFGRIYRLVPQQPLRD